jgi:hypothetical protein
MLTKCVGNFHVRKHVKSYIKAFYIFYIFDFLSKYLCIITHTCENHHHHENYHNLNYPISFT